MKHIVFALALWLLPFGAMAQDDANLERRLELAKEIQKVRPVQSQVDGALERYLQSVPESQRDSYRRALQGVLSYKALEKISNDAYAEVYSEAELSAMLEYYKKPESLSAAKKSDQYAGRVLPEIMRMLDRAMMRVRTGG